MLNAFLNRFDIDTFAELLPSEYVRGLPFVELRRRRDDAEVWIGRLHITVSRRLDRRSV